MAGPDLRVWLTENLAIQLGCEMTLASGKHMNQLIPPEADVAVVGGFDTWIGGLARF